MLIICFGVNPNGKSKSPLDSQSGEGLMIELERWYVCGSIALGFFIPLIPTALGHFGHDEILNTWYVHPRCVR